MSSPTPAVPAAHPPSPTRRGPRRAVLIGVLAVALIAGVVWLAHWWTVGRFIESTDDAYLQADSVTAAPKIAGYVTKVYVADNQTVQAGDPLVELDTQPYQVSLDQAQATVTARQADIAQAQAQIAQQGANIAQAAAQQRAAQIGADHASQEVKRYAPLAETGADTKEHLSQLTSTRDQALATLAADNAALAAARAQNGITQAQLGQARAQLGAAQANAEQARLDLVNTVIRAASAGRVGDRAVRVGQYAQAGTRLLTVVPLQALYLVANFKETQIARMRVGQPAKVHVDALGGRALDGSIESFAPGTGAQFALLPPENATGNFTKIVQRVPVRIRVQADPGLRPALVPGLSVTVDVDTRDDGRSGGSGGTHG